MMGVPFQAPGLLVAAANPSPLEAIPWSAALAWILIIGAGLACLWWVRRGGGVPGLGSARRTVAGEEMRLAVEGAVRLGPRASVVALRAGRRRFVLAATDKGIEALAHWEVDEEADEVAVGRPRQRAGERGRRRGASGAWPREPAGPAPAHTGAAGAGALDVQGARSSRTVGARASSSPLNELDRIRQRLQAWQAGTPADLPEASAPPTGSMAGKLS